MPLLDDSGLRNDPWTRIAADAAWPNAGDVLVDFNRREDAPIGAQFGVDVGPNVDLDALIADQGRFALIAVQFPKYADGRGFSIARRLRAAGYDGRLRAVGPVIADQFDYLRACGFDEIEVDAVVADRQPFEQWRIARGALSRRYQRGYGETASVADLRHDAAGGDDRLAA